MRIVFAFIAFSLIPSLSMANGQPERQGSAAAADARARPKRAARGATLTRKVATSQLAAAAQPTEHVDMFDIKTMTHISVPRKVAEAQWQRVAEERRTAQHVAHEAELERDRVSFRALMTGKSTQQVRADQQDAQLRAGW